MRPDVVLSGGAVIAGAALALGTTDSAPLLAVGLLGAALALGTRARLALAALAIGLLSVWTRPPAELRGFDSDLVVAVEGRRLAPWRRDAFGWSAPIRLHRISQGRRVEATRAKLWLALGGPERPPAGRRVRARGYLARRSGVRNGGRAVPAPMRLRVKSRRLARFAGAEVRWLAALRSAGLERAERSDGAALARALVLGDRSALRPGLVRSFRRAGLGHLLALSGLHVGILAALGLWLGRAGLGCWAGGRWQWLVPALASIVFVVVAGPRPAVLRATLMALLAWAALARGSPPLSWHALGLIVAGMVAGEPELLRDLGFQLTVAATAGILWQARIAGARQRPLVGALRVSLAAQLWTLPWTLPAFHLLTPGAWIHNLWAVPWTAVCLLAGLLWIGLAALSPAAARSVEVVVDVGAAPFRWISRLPAGPWWSVPLAAGRAEAVALALAGSLILRWPRRGLLWVAGLGLLAGVVDRGPEAAGPELVMLDVGQGEALVVRDGGAAVLIDGGGWARGDFGGRVLVPALARLGVRRLRAVVLTHPDLDHCGGLADLVAYLPVAELWTPAGWPPDRCVLELLTSPRLGWRPIWAGWSGRIGRWRLRALSPRAGRRGRGNDRSLVLSAKSRGFTALLTGDVESGAERALLTASRGALLADLLKVPHHGSRTSTGEAFLEAVSPRLAWISAGRSNRYGHPHPAVIARLSAKGARILRTDRDGQLRLWVGAKGALRISLPGAPR